MSLLRRNGHTVKRELVSQERAREAFLMPKALDLAVAAYEAQKGAARAVEAERERCLAICRKYPDNLMAAHIAREIGTGRGA